MPNLRGNYQRRVVLEAAFFLGFSRVAVAVLPFPLLRRLLGGACAPSPASEEPRPPAAEWCRIAVERAAVRLPFETNCLPRAIAGQFMLLRRGLPASVVFGLAWRGGVLLNHAWLEHEGRAVMGDEPGTAFTRTVEFQGLGRVRNSRIRSPGYPARRNEQGARLPHRRAKLGYDAAGATTRDVRADECHFARRPCSP